MNIEYNNLLKGFQATVVSYQDISAIYTKLISQGQVQKLATLFHEIYDEEHVFTLTELQRYCKENGQREDEFIAEQYELNSNIFRRNLTLIVQNLVEEVGRNFLDKFKFEFSNRSSRSKEGQYEEQQTSEQSYEKSQYKSNMPEIQEETEQSAGVPQQPTSSTFRAKTNETEVDQPNLSPNKFDLNINDLNKRVQTQPSQGQQMYRNNQNNQTNHSNEYKSHNQSPQEYNQRAVSRQSEEQYKRAYATEPEREEAYNNAMSSLREDEYNGATNDNNNRYEGFNQYENDSQNYKANLQKYYKQPANQNNFQQFTKTQFNNNPNWSSPDRTRALANKNMTPSSHKKTTKAASPSPNRMDGSTNNSYMNRSVSRWSSTNDRPDPSVLDSEFSYVSNQSFAKSPKKFHWNINKVPGPGQYELEESKKLVRSVTPDVSFPKSNKDASYIKKNNVPGPIYYPVKHFLSK